MKKRLVMSALCLALSSNASAYLVETVGTLQLTTKLQEKNCKDFLQNQLIQELINTLHETKTSIDGEVLNLNKIYIKIDKSIEPELFFTEKSMNDLKYADSFIRNMEDMLKVHAETCKSKFEHETELNASLHALRVSTAKLRMGVGSLLQIERQLHESPVTNESTFDMYVASVQSMKEATKKAYFH